MDKVRIGIIGLGNMGKGHISNFNAGKISNGYITAVCDIDEEALESGANLVNHEVKKYKDAIELMESGEVDAVMIETPHYLHPTLAIEALNRGLHTLIEKPAGVYTKQVREMNEIADKSGLVFGAMFNQRTNPLYIKLKELMDSGEVGEFRRVNWIVTNWYRTQSYYNSGSWRATWEGEGGGVLLNQLPHQIDLLQWICGMPSKITGFCSYGKFHDIEVEDDITAYMEFPNGATGVLVSTTGEAPGTNRLEIVGTKGKIVVEKSNCVYHGPVDDCINFYRTREDVAEHLKSAKGGFDVPETWHCKIEVQGNGGSHPELCTNFCNAILNGTPLLAPGQDGINGVTISNAIHLSDWLGKTIELPIDEDLFYEKLQEKIKNSTFVKAEVVKNDAGFENSF